MEQRWAGQPSNPTDPLRNDQFSQSRWFTFPSSSVFLGCLCYELLLSQEVTAKTREMIRRSALLVSKQRQRHPEQEEETSQGSHSCTAAASNKNRLLCDWKWPRACSEGQAVKCTAWVLLPAQPVVKVVDWRLVLLSLLSASSKMFTFLCKR